MSKEQKRPLQAPPIGDLMAAKSGQIQKIYQHALKLIELQKKLKATLPAPLSDHVSVASLSNHTLTVHTSSAAWAARLRFKTPDMLATLNREKVDSPIKTIRIKVNPPDFVRQKTPEKLSLSPATSQLLQNVADSISDPELRESLLRLSRNR